MSLRETFSAPARLGASGDRHKSSSREETKLISQLESLTPGRPILFDSRIKDSLQEVVFGSSLRAPTCLY